MKEPVAPDMGPCGTPAALFRTRMSHRSKKSGGERARNRYAGTCCVCGRHVPAGAGCIEKNDEGWHIFC